VKTTILLGFLFIFSISLLSAQEYFLFNDEFIDNQKQWPTGNSASYVVFVKQGDYHVSIPQNTGSINLTQPISIDQNSDFIIESKITLKSGSKKCEYGLIWGTADLNNSYSFLICPKGNVIIQEIENDTTKNISILENVTAINAIGFQNILKIAKKGDSITFNINHHDVLSIPHLVFKGSMVGFKFANRIEADVDYLTVKQDVRIHIVDQPINGFSLQNLGNLINTSFSEISPVISPDGNTLYVCRDNNLDYSTSSLQTIYYCTRQEDGYWGELKDIGKPLNNGSNNAVVSVVSADGNVLLVRNSYNLDGSYKGTGMSITKKINNEWTIPVPIEIDDFYNESEYQSMSLTADQNFLISAIKRRDSYGGEDLYVSFKKEGRYTKPLNLGHTINTVEDDFTPFLAADNITLYYATEGKPGYGSADIFVTKRLDDSWVNWSEPKNLGPEINSSEWDAYYTLPASGEYAFMVSSNNSFGKSDIFMIKQTEDAKPNPVTLLFGKVLNAKNNQPIEAEITYSILANDSIIGRAISEPVSGNYKIILPYNNEYSFMAVKGGFYSISDNIDMSNIDKYTEIERNLYLSPIETGDIIRLNNIFFDYDSNNLKIESFFELDRLLELLVANPKLEIKIGGHTDGDGSDEYNLKLSMGRAMSVVQYLIEKGIEKERLTGIGFGKQIPIATNNTEEGKALNRRVEFTIIKGVSNEEEK
jgi:outer membrane protein OmpA-like peptidoglycan-associated protein